ncbi:hypothetical protein CRUP_030734, partial [Coryphaenoides rupestris]
MNGKEGKAKCACDEDGDGGVPCCDRNIQPKKPPVERALPQLPKASRSGVDTELRSYNRHTLVADPFEDGLSDLLLKKHKMIELEKK